MKLKRPINYYFKYPLSTFKLLIKLIYDSRVNNNTPMTLKSDLDDIQVIIDKYEINGHYKFNDLLLSKEGFNLDLFFNVIYPYLNGLKYDKENITSFYKSLKVKWQSLAFYAHSRQFLVNKKGIIAHGVPYFYNNCIIDKNDIAIDLGAAPGDFGAFALTNGAKKVYCFDTNVEMGLRETAELNQNKISIIASYVSNSVNEGNTTTLDHFCSSIPGENISFIKMDIEGEEINAIKGAKKIIAEQKPKMAICVYHDYSHYRRIKKLIKSINSDYKFESLGPVLYCTPVKNL